MQHFVVLPIMQQWWQLYTILYILMWNKWCHSRFCVEMPSDSLWLVRNSGRWAGLCVRWWWLGLCDWSVSAGQRPAAADEDSARRRPNPGRSGLVCSMNPELPECQDAAAAADAGSQRLTRDDVWNTKTLNSLNSIMWNVNKNISGKCWFYSSNQWAAPFLSVFVHVTNQLFVLRGQVFIKLCFILIK